MFYFRLCKTASETQDTICGFTDTTQKTNMSSLHGQARFPTFEDMDIRQAEFHDHVADIFVM